MNDPGTPASSSSAEAQVRRLESQLLLQLREAWRQRDPPEWLPTEVSQEIEQVVATVRAEHGLLFEQIRKLGRRINLARLAAGIDTSLDAERVWVKADTSSSETQIGRVESRILSDLKDAWRRGEPPEQLRAGLSDEISELVAIVRAEHPLYLNRIRELTNELHDTNAASQGGM